jgi:hypothetical protein
MASRQRISQRRICRSIRDCVWSLFVLAAPHHDRQCLSPTATHAHKHLQCDDGTKQASFEARAPNSVAQGCRLDAARWMGCPYLLGRSASLASQAPAEHGREDQVQAVKVRKPHARRQALTGAVVGTVHPIGTRNASRAPTSSLSGAAGVLPHHSSMVSSDGAIRSSLLEPDTRTNQTWRGPHFVQDEEITRPR